MNRRTLLKSLAAIMAAPAVIFRPKPKYVRGRGTLIKMTISEPLTSICHVDRWVDLRGPFTVVGHVSRGST